MKRHQASYSLISYPFINAGHFRRGLLSVRLLRCLGANRSISSVLLVVLSVFVLSSCANEYASPLLGTWKDADQNRYMSIEQHGTEYKVVMFVSNEKPLLQGMDSTNGIPNMKLDSSAMEFSRTIDAALQDGILTIKIDDESEVPLLYNPNDKALYVNGIDVYTRVHIEV